MVVIGIDPGTALTGYGVIEENEDGSIQLIDYGVIRTGSAEKPEIRLVSLFSGLKKIINLHQPDSGAVESLFFQKNVKTAISVGQARGVALLALAENGIPVQEYTPLEVKQAVTGYGRADKLQVQQMVQVILEMRELPEPDDAADALAVAICHTHCRWHLDDKKVPQ